MQPDRQQVIFRHTAYDYTDTADILHKIVVSCNVLSTRRSPFELVTWFADDIGLWVEAKRTIRISSQRVWRPRVGEELEYCESDPIAINFSTE